MQQHGLIGVGVLLQDRYQLVELIGQGGMGSVYKAYDEMLDRVVAIKVLSPELIHNAEAVAIFEHEARVLARTHHPNLVSVYDVFRVEDYAFMCMEYVEGRSGDEIVAMYPEGVPLDDGIHVATQLLAVLCYLHEKGIIHRDIKPNNFIVEPDGTLRLLDFGLARELELLVQKGTRVRGSPAYISPEHVVGQELTPGSDLYSFGVTLFEMFTGRLPFEHGDLSYHHIHTKPPAPEELRRDLPAPLAQLIRSSIRKSPSDRPHSAKAALRMLVNGLGSTRRSYPPSVISILDLGTPLKITSDFGEPSTTNPQRTLPGPVGLSLAASSPAANPFTPAPPPSPKPVAPPQPIAPPQPSPEATSIPIPPPERSSGNALWIAGGGLLAGAAIVCAVFWLMLGATDTPAPPSNPATGALRAVEPPQATEPETNQGEAAAVKDDSPGNKAKPPATPDDAPSDSAEPVEDFAAEDLDDGTQEEPAPAGTPARSPREIEQAKQAARKAAATRAAKRDNAPKAPSASAATEDKVIDPPPAAPPKEAEAPINTADAAKKGDTTPTTPTTAAKEEPAPPTPPAKEEPPAPTRKEETTSPSVPAEGAASRPYAPSKPSTKEQPKPAAEQPKREVPFGF